MKNRILNRFFNLLLLSVMAMMLVVSCKDDDDDDNNNPIVILDGYYIKGAGTALSDFNDNGMFKVTRNEVRNGEYNSGAIEEDDRPELKEIYMAVKAGADGFNIVMVSGSTQKTYGPGSDFALVDPANLDGEEPTAGLWRGTLAETTTPFTVPTDGLYHIAFDTELMIVVIAKVEWGVIGAATPNGWSGSTAMTASAFDLNTMTFEIPEIIMIENVWKFRYSDGWKIILDADFDNGTATPGLRVNSNFGGTVDDLVPGGSDMSNSLYAKYKITMTWSLTGGHTATMVKVGDAPPLPEYPEAMYIVGDATAYGWATPGTVANAIMHKCAGGVPSEGIYWKICYIEGGLGFKVSDENWGSYNYGFNEIEEFDADGVDVTESGGNMSIATSGMYMVVLSLRDDMVKLSVKAAEVYGIGDAFGGWDEDKPENLFTNDDVNKTVNSPALAADGNIRMYAQHPWIPDWWNAEFRVFNGAIEYRNDGGDQEAVPGTTGQVVTLHFDDNTGTIL